MTVLELVDRIVRLMESDVRPLVQNQASHEIRHQYLSAEKARRVLGWQPMFTLDEGLRRAVAWYTDFLAETN